MALTKVLLGLTVLAVLCITYTHSLQCYTCNDKKSCSSAKKVECNPNLANQTRLYLDVYHKNVNLNLTSPYIDCFREYHKSSNGEVYYKGCIYQNANGCSLQMKDHFMQGKFTRDCNQCNNKNGCNPAGRIELNTNVPLIALLMAAIGKFVWSA